MVAQCSVPMMERVQDNVITSSHTTQMGEVRIYKPLKGDVLCQDVSKMRLAKTIKPKKLEKADVPPLAPNSNWSRTFTCLGCKKGPFTRSNHAKVRCDPCRTQRKKDLAHKFYKENKARYQENKKKWRARSHIVNGKKV